MNRSIPWIVAFLLFAACKGESPSSIHPDLSRPSEAPIAGRPSESGRQPPQATETARSGPVELELQLLETVLPKPGSLAYFHARLSNEGTVPFEYSPDFFSDPRSYPSRAGIYLEIEGPGKTRVEMVPYLGGHGPYTALSDEQLAELESLRRRIEAAVLEARRTGRDESAAVAEATGSTPATAPILMPGASATTQAWHSPTASTPPHGYTQVPFYLNTAGTYRIRLVYDFTARKDAGARHAQTPWITLEVRQ